MSITVEFYAGFREVVGKSKVVLETPKDVKTLLKELVEEFGPKLAEQLYEPGTQKLRDTVNVLVNGRSIILLEGENTPLKNGDSVAIFPPVAGG